MTTTAKTVRRTAKITTKPYAPAALTRVYDKATGVCLGYLAPSRDNKETYQITCDENAIWHCTCKATIENCCHVKAAKELCAIRVKQGRPACRAASFPEPEMSEEDREQLAIVVAKMSEDVTAELVATPAPAEVAQPTTERAMKVVKTGDRHEPQYRDGDDAWEPFRDEAGEVIWFTNGRTAFTFILEDSDEHRAAVLARPGVRGRDLVAVAADNAAQAGPAIDKAFAESERRLTSTLKAGRGIGLAPIVAPTIKTAWLPTR